MEKVLKRVDGIQAGEAEREDTVVAPSLVPASDVERKILDTEVEVLARLAHRVDHAGAAPTTGDGASDIVAVRQGNCFGTSFHPELTDDPRIHIWWLQEVVNALRK